MRTDFDGSAPSSSATPIVPDLGRLLSDEVGSKLTALDASASGEISRSAEALAGVTKVEPEVKKASDEGTAEGRGGATRDARGVEPLRATRHRAASKRAWPSASTT